ncbi:MAG: hypothetical protein V4724_40375 [Pseudomonadota bacterium]
MNRSCLRLACLFCALLLTACASSTPQWDSRFGDAARSAFAQQVIDPQAVRNADPVAGIDGRAARNAQERYQKSYSEPAQQPSSFVIGVSGGK